MKTNRRGFIAAIFAAPLAVTLGIFAGNHISDKVKVTEVWMRMHSKTREQLTYTTASIHPGKDRLVVVAICDSKSGKGEVLRYMDYPGENPPWVHIGSFKNCDGIESVSVKGVFVDQHAIKGNFAGVEL